MTRVHARPAPEVVQRLLALVARPESSDEPGDEQADRAAVEDEAAVCLSDVQPRLGQAPAPSGFSL